MLVGLMAFLGHHRSWANVPQIRSSDPYLQCVPYARATSGIAITGDAHTWWNQAKGNYDRGDRPRVAAVMAFKPYGSMRLGHVATVSKIIDKRTILINHANWSPINGRRGQIERNVMVKDVSDDNDWSKVRVWFAPLGDLGTTTYPLHGFIYGDGRLRDPGNQFAGVPVHSGKHVDFQSSSPQKAPRLAYAMSVLKMPDRRKETARSTRVPMRPDRFADAKVVRPTSRLKELQVTVARLR